MTPEERDLITSLFDRLRQAENGSAPKDREAEQLISRQVTTQPAAPYQLVQTVLVQEHALTNAQQRIAELERQIAANPPEGHPAPSGGGSFLSGLFGGGASNRPAAPQAPYTAGGGGMAPPPMPAAYPSTTNMAPSAGGGFLRSALATAAGVAGGSLLFQGIGNLLGHNAGPFSSFMGPGGGAGMSSFTGGGGMPMGGGNTEVINNYYGGDGGGSGFEGHGHHHHGGGSGGGTVGDFADQTGGGGDSAGFLPSDFENSDGLVSDGLDNYADNGGAGDGIFDDSGGSSDDGTLV